MSERLQANLFANPDQITILPAAYQFAEEYPLSPNLYTNPEIYIPINIDNFEPITQSLISLYKGSALEQVINTEIAQAIRPKVDYDFEPPKFQLPEIYRSIQTGLTENDREFEIIAGSPEFRFGQSGELTLQDIIIRLNQYQNPLKIQAEGRVSDTLLSPWLMSKNYNGRFLNLTKQLTSIFATAIGVGDEAIPVKFVDSYGGEAVDNVRLSKLLTHSGMERLDLHEKQNFTKVIVGNHEYAGLNDYYASRAKPLEGTSKTALLKAIYAAYLDKFITHVNKIQNISLMAAADFITQIDTKGRDSKLIPMVSRVIYDTWPATLLFYWRERISRPVSEAIQGKEEKPLIIQGRRFS